MKILYVTTVAGTMGFFTEHFKMLIDEGHTIEIACNITSPIKDEIINLGIKTHNICFSRNPFSSDNIDAYKSLKNLVKTEKYDVVHCHTPNASAITRLACKSLKKKGLKVFYTAHGFHFYKGAPLINWIIYYPVEWICAHWTDLLITINHEDYKLAKKHMHAGKVEYLPGVGVDLKKFGNIEIDRIDKREQIGVPKDAKVILSVGELNVNKNHQIIIRALSNINNPDIHYVIAGDGNQKDELLKLADELGVSKKLHLLGVRTDVAELYNMADIYALPSLREGLNVSIMEAMASGLPCVVSRIRGNVDLLDSKGGQFYNPVNCDEVKKSIEQVLNKSIEERHHMGIYNKNKVVQFDIEVVKKRLQLIYEQV